MHPAVPTYPSGWSWRLVCLSAVGLTARTARTEGQMLIATANTKSCPSHRLDAPAGRYPNFELIRVNDLVPLGAYENPPSRCRFDSAGCCFVGVGARREIVWFLRNRALLNR